MPKLKEKRTAPRRGEIVVETVISTEAIDLEAWAWGYVCALFEAKGYVLPREHAA